MGKPLLLLRLEGPLQSWGVRSHWDVRDTSDEPSKSGIIGLLGCALGYPAKDSRLVELDRVLALGVRTEHPGLPLVDFHTVSDVLPTADGTVKGSLNNPATIISFRTYLEDAAFLAVLSGPGSVLRQCQTALAHPKWPVYLGRKACPPTRPVLETLSTAYEDMEDALRHHPWDWEGRVIIDQDKLPTQLWCTMEDPEGTALRADRVQAHSNRMFLNRAVKVFSTPFPGVSLTLAQSSEKGPTACI